MTCRQTWQGCRKVGTSWRELSLIVMPVGPLSTAYASGGALGIRESEVHGLALSKPSHCFYVYAAQV